MNKPRARQLGWLTSSWLDPGPKNAITDLDGVMVGHTTRNMGAPGPLEVGSGPVRTGVTAIHPYGGNLFRHPVAANVHVLNGFGKTVGLEQIRELGTLETPILLTNTLNVWRCADALVDWMLAENPEIGITRGSLNPVVGECNDGWLNDIQGRHVTKADVFNALESARCDRVIEGNVGAGTGTLCYGFKGGMGTASRVICGDKGDFTLGVLLQANFGSREQLVLRGQPVGQALKDWPSEAEDGVKMGEIQPEDGSCMMVIATDAPLSTRQLGRLARRAPLGLARTGFTSNSGSGDYVIAFSNSGGPRADQTAVPQLMDEGTSFGSLIQAVVEATDEAVLNTLAAAETMTGRDGHSAIALPVDIIQPWLKSMPDLKTVKDTK